ncbi:putative integral membrane protein [Cryptosporidium felis]|nr:putative integral membrane protein [Cryptosporidium felis]
MNFDKELIKELKLKEIPINLILNATCNSPPGIKHRQAPICSQGAKPPISSKIVTDNGLYSLGLEDDQLNLKDQNSNLVNIQKFGSKFKKEVSNDVIPPYKKSTTSHSSRPKLKKIIPTFQLPINSDNIVSLKDHVTEEKDDSELVSGTDSHRFNHKYDIISSYSPDNLCFGNVNTEVSFESYIRAEDENGSILKNKSIHRSSTNSELKLESNPESFSDSNIEFSPEIEPELKPEPCQVSESESGIDPRFRLDSVSGRMQRPTSISVSDSECMTNFESEFCCQQDSEKLDPNPQAETFTNEKNPTYNLEKLVPVFSKPELNDGIVIQHINNREKYSRIFKDDEEFSCIFEKFWNEAGKELLDKKVRHQINSEKDYPEPGRHQNLIQNDPQKDEIYLNPVPFQSDLLKTSLKRKIKTTIPFEDLKRNSSNAHLNSVINPIGLLKSLKNRHYENEFEINTIQSQEDLSTRASTFNNVVNFGLETAADSVNTLRKNLTNNRFVSNTPSIEDSLISFNVSGEKVTEITEDIKVRDKIEDESYYQREINNSNHNQYQSTISGKEKREELNAFENFLTIRKFKNVNRVKINNEHQKSIEKLKENLREINSKYNSLLLDGNETTLLTSIGNDARETIYHGNNDQDPGKIRGVQDLDPEQKKDHVFIDIREQTYDYGFELEEKRVRLQEKIKEPSIEMNIREFQASPLESNSEFGSSVENKKADYTENENPENSIQDHFITLEVESEQKNKLDSDNAQGAEKDLKSGSNRIGGSGDYYTSATVHYNGFGLIQDCYLAFKRFSLSRILESHVDTGNRLESKVKGNIRLGNSVFQQNFGHNWNETRKSYEKLQLSEFNKSVLRDFLLSLQRVSKSAKVKRKETSDDEEYGDEGFEVNVQEQGYDNLQETDVKDQEDIMEQRTRRLRKQIDIKS